MEKIANAIASLWSIVNGWYDSIVNSTSSFFSVVRSVFSFFIEIFGALFYLWKSLLIAIWKLFQYVISWEAFIKVFSTLKDISTYIGGPATAFLSALLFVIIARIIIAFLFKILRLNLDYNSLQTNTMKNNKDIISRKHNLFK